MYVYIVYIIWNLYVSVCFQLLGEGRIWKSMWFQWKRFGLPDKGRKPKGIVSAWVSFPRDLAILSVEEQYRTVRLECSENP